MSSENNITTNNIMYFHYFLEGEPVAPAMGNAMPAATAGNANPNLRDLTFSYSVKY